MANYLGFNPTERKEDYYFISYSSEDVEYVGSISRKLHDQNIPVWYDYGIDYGNKWEATISKKIIHCTAVILFFSLRILQKKDSYVLKELEIAKDFGKPVYPVLLEEVDIKKVPEETYHHWVSIKSYQGIAAFNMNQETVLSELKRALALSPVKPETDSVQTKPGTGTMTEIYDPSSAQPASNIQNKKDHESTVELEQFRKDILACFSDDPECINTELLKTVKEYYQKCTEVYGESNTLTADAYELLAYITYSKRNYRDAMPLLEKVYQRKTRESGEFHPETIDVLFMLADASQKKESIFPSLKYPKAFRKLADEFLGEEYPSSSLWKSVALCKPWYTYEYVELGYDDNIEILKNYCDVKLLSNYVGEEALKYRKQRQRSRDESIASYLKNEYEEVPDRDCEFKLEYRLYVTDHLYGPLSDQSVSLLGTLSRRFWHDKAYRKSIYYYRLLFERSLLRMENNISDSRSDTKNYAKQLYDCYKSMNLETCPQAQEAYQKYQELSSR